MNGSDPSGLCNGNPLSVSFWTTDNCVVDEVGGPQSVASTAQSAWYHVDRSWDCLTSACYSTKQGFANLVAGAHNSVNYISGLAPVPAPYPCTDSGAYDLGGQVPYAAAFTVPGLGAGAVDAIEANAAEGLVAGGEDPAWSPPDVYMNGSGQLTNGVYTVSDAKMAVHMTGSLAAGKSQWFSYVDAETATLDAAAYADANGLWVGNTAKVAVTNGDVGVLGRSGAPTSWINVYRTNTGFVHGSPGNAP